MRIMITGGAGCLGSNLIEHWLPSGHEILVIDNFATGKREVVPDVPGLSVIEGCVSDYKMLHDCFSNFMPQILVHAAASYKDPDDWTNDAVTNVIGSANIAKLSKEFGIKRLINFQTALCYGRPETLPIPTSHRTAPFTSYGVTKTAGEHFILLSGVPTVSLRLANVTGPRLAIGPIPTFYKRLKGGQSCFCSDSSRDFLDMRDFLAFMDLAIDEDAPEGIYNVSSGEAHSIKEVFDLVCEYLGLGKIDVPSVPVGEDDVPVVVLDPLATQNDFGWMPQHGFAETILNQLSWYDEHGVTDIHSHLKDVAEG
ncbi:MAG: NAD-dependent epimerase/dehydratase family protein [Alphaproteobacteria bacterium]|nr:NAD-dependent epimerase/dehydratase family protein [Alphaproteobacteria bacterium]